MLDQKHRYRTVLLAGGDPRVSERRAPIVAAAQADVIPVPGLDSRLVALVGERLRALHDNLLREPVPDRFLELLGQLDKTSTEPRHG